MKYRIALAAMLVAVGIGAAWLLIDSQRAESVASPSASRGAAPLPVASLNAASAPAASAWSVPTNQTPTVRGTLPFVVKSAVPIDKPLRLAIESMGAKTVESLAKDALLVEADGATRARLLADSRFASSEELLPASKVEPELAARLASGAEAVDVAVVTLSAEDRASLLAFLASNGGRLLKGCLNAGAVLRANIPASAVAQLAQRGDVRWMETFERPVQLNDKAMEPETMAVREVWDTHGLTGEGQFISTSDSGIDTGDVTTMHDDLKDRVLDMRFVDDATTTDLSGHGTHTAGSIVGTGAKSSGAIRGTAYGAHLYAWFCGSDDLQSMLIPDTLSELYTADGAWNAYLHSGSWGSALAGRYTTECAEHDQYVWEHPEYLPIFSAGNSGPNGSTVGSPAASKNVLAVGATQNLRTGHDGSRPNGDPTQTTSFSSRGPCRDGRIKPDIAAPGAGIVSVRSSAVEGDQPLYGVYEDNENYLYCSGTSMSCPLTAGAVVLVRQWLVERMGFTDVDGQRPTAALMKAVITGGAKDAATPNNEQGWGRVDLTETLFPSNRAVRLVDRIPFAANTNFVYIVETTNAAPLDVQLVWVDYPGSASASQSAAKLVNDLDLTVERSIAGVDEIWYGNGGDEPDTLNNVESVRLDAATPSKYIITVNCKTVLHDSTEGGAAALYIRGAFDPAADPEPPANVRIVERDLGFRYLKDALAAVEEGETVEIFYPINLNTPVTVSRSCTIVATNLDARASAVNVTDGASLTVGAGARVLLQNVVFTNAPCVMVEAGGTLALSGLVVPGEVMTSDETGLELAGEITEPIIVHAPDMELGGVFGTTNGVTELVAETCAELFTNLDDDELIGMFKDGVFQWEVRPVSDDEAVAVLTQGGATENFKSFRLLSQRLSGEASVAFRKSCSLGVTLNVTDSLTLAADAGVVITNDVSNPTEIVVEEGGALVLGDITFAGSADQSKWGEKFIRVTGGELTLESGALLQDIVLKSPNTSGVTYGPITVESGTVTMKSGAEILGCRAPMYGGGIYAWSGLVKLEGGTISNCWAAVQGGGVYAVTLGGRTRVQLSGDITVRGNTYKSNPVISSDIGVSTTKRAVEIVAPLTGAVGIDHIGNDNLAATFDPTDPAFTEEATAMTAENIVSDAQPDEDGYVERAVVDGATFVWARTPPYVSEGSPDAVVRLVYPDGTRESYRSIGEAFKYMVGDCAVELLTNIVYRENFTIAYDITLRSDPAAGLVYELARSNDCQMVVNEGFSVVLTNVCLSAAIPPSADPTVDPATLHPTSSDLSIIQVNAGGALTLDAGAVVSGMWKDASYEPYARIAPGIFINGGTLTMNPGSCVANCRNLWVDTVEKNRDSSRGGGVTLYDGAVGYFNGGSITNCQAAIGGGLAVWSGSQAYVSGDFTVKNNLSSIAPDYLGDDISVEAGSTLTVTGPLADSARLGFRCEYAADTNLAAVVSDWSAQWTGESLAIDAAKCFKSDDKEIRGIAATNETDAVIVWKSALEDDGTYRPESGEIYYALPEAPNPDPEEQWAEPKPIAFKSIAVTNQVATLVVTDAVQWCEYKFFATNSLVGGFILTNGVGELVVDPVTNFQWKTTEPEIELTFPATDEKRFWKATAHPGLIP